jgi:hypothetical protein
MGYTHLIMDAVIERGLKLPMSLKTSTTVRGH